MQPTAPQLEKQAIKCALEANWKEAVEINKNILAKNPGDLKTKLRLGQAYLQLKNFTSAAKLFKEVLKEDPINTIAAKNYELATQKKRQTTAKLQQNGSSLIKEPGTTSNMEIEISAKGVTAKTIPYGTLLEIKILKARIELKCEGKPIGSIKDKTFVQKLNQAKKSEIEITATAMKGEGKQLEVLFKAAEPIFKGYRQEIKPYMVKGAIKETKIEIEQSDSDD